VETARRFQRHQKKPGPKDLPAGLTVYKNIAWLSAFVKLLFDGVAYQTLTYFIREGYRYGNIMGPIPGTLLPGTYDRHGSGQTVWD